MIAWNIYINPSAERDTPSINKVHARLLQNAAHGLGFESVILPETQPRTLRLRHRSPGAMTLFQLRHPDLFKDTRVEELPCLGSC